MSKTRIALAAVVVGLVTLFSSTAAQAYPDPVITSPGGSAADGQVAPGETFTLTGTFGGVDCFTWTSAFTGQPGVNGGAGSGTSFSVTYTAPTEPGSFSVNITCDYDDGTPATTAPVSYNAAALPALPQTLTVSFPIAVGTPGAGTGTDAGTGSNTDSNGVLPNTGGPAFLMLLVGGALVAGGASIAVARRRTA